MAVEVSSVTRTLKRYAEDEKGKRELVTRDLLGGGAVVGNGELDLEIKVVRSGWERRLDLMPAKNYQPLHDLNLPPPPPSASASASTADFNLLSAAPSRASHSSSSPAVSAYSSSVCTLDKVRSALERESRGARPAPRSDSPSSPSSSSSAAAKRLQSPPPRDSPISRGEMRAAACPTCLIYVLIAAVDPRCPRCDAQVPALPVLTQPHKKPRIDLNAAAEDND
ncbi:uncharacterized protein [Typha latifolia]|uniref:uncharacterized protein n=1 Tax=Typha latifolia TaxID=4733 RepID=UPI003C2CD62A